MAQDYNDRTQQLELIRLFRITDRDKQLIKGLEPWFKKNMDRLVDAFYAHLAEFPEAVDVIVRAGSSIERLKKTNPRYFDELLRAEFDDRYFASRQIVGKVHAAIGLPTHLFMGSLTTYYDEILTRLVQSMKFNPTRAGQAVTALQKVFALDQAIIMTSLVNAYTDRILNSANEATRVADRLGVNSSELRSATNECSQATAGVAQATSELARGSAAQAESAAEVSVAMDAISRTADGIGQGIQRQVSAIGRVEATLEGVQNSLLEIGTHAEIWETLQAKVKTVEQLTQSARHSADSVRAMHEAAAHIEAIVSTIENVAEQTNLLALNAAIEAARAGEHGRGFAVVADQVRKLAEESSNSSQKIADLIRSIQDQGVRTSQAMDETITHVTDVVDLASKSVAALSAISSSSGKAAEMNDQLSVSMGQVRQVAAENAELISFAEEQVGQVRNSLADVVAVITENSASTSEVEASASEVGRQLHDLVDSAVALDSLVEDLRQLNVAIKLEEARLGQAA